MLLYSLSCFLIFFIKSYVVKIHPCCLRFIIPTASKSHTILNVVALSAHTCTLSRLPQLPVIYCECLQCVCPWGFAVFLFADTLEGQVLTLGWEWGVTK